MKQAALALTAADAARLGEVVQAEALTLLAGLVAESVQIIIADPPYGIAYHSNHYVDRNPHHPISQDWNFQIGPFFAEAERALSSGGALYLFTRWDVYPIWTREIPSSLALKNAIIWRKDNWSSGDLTGNFGFQYEVILFIVKGRHHLRGHRWPNIWDCPRIPAKKLRMPAEKPAALYERALLSSSDAGDLAVDPFAGSGTLAEVAIHNGRRFLCGDLDPRMVAMARERIGLPVVTGAPSRPLPPCPVFQVQPPDPSLWGVHPEDIWALREARGQ